MAPVVKELSALLDQDIRAMAVYLASFNANRPVNRTMKQSRSNLKA
jgi:nicotinate dehydrogenase subunit B